jgi:hypothetical protein
MRLEAKNFHMGTTLSFRRPTRRQKMNKHYLIVTIRLDVTSVEEKA